MTRRTRRPIFSPSIFSVPDRSARPASLPAVTTPPTTSRATAGRGVGLLERLNPFRGLPNPKRVLAWSLYDLANQSFTLLIITLLFGLYVQKVVTPHPPVPSEMREAVQAAMREGDTEKAAPSEEAVEAAGHAPASSTKTDTEGVASDPPVDDPAAAAAQATPQRVADLAREQRRADDLGKWNWALLGGASLLIVVVLSPLLGALADCRGWRKRFLVASGVVCSLLTCALAFIGTGDLLLAAAIYIPANVCFQLGENFLASFLTDVSTPKNIGRVSATGWTMGYVGALVLLIITAGVMSTFKLLDPASWRPFFVFAGVWFLVGIIPATIVLPRDCGDGLAARDGLIAQSFGRTVETFRRAMRYRQLMAFLLAFFVYGFGVQVVVGFAAIIAGSFGFNDVLLIVFTLQITITAGLSSFATGFFQHRLGIKATISVFLAVWIVSCAGLLAARLIWPTDGPQWPIWVVGNGLGFGLGGIGTASRAMVGRFTPAHRTGEFFGLWGLSYKLAGAVGVLSFGGIARLFGDAASLALLLGFFVAGAMLMVPVNEVRGYRAAARAQRDHLRAAHAVPPGPGTGFPH